MREVEVVIRLPQLLEDMTYAFRIFRGEWWLAGFKTNRISNDLFAVHRVGLGNILQILRNNLGSVIDEALKDFSFRLEGDYYYFTKSELEDFINRLSRAGLDVEIILLYEWRKGGA